MIIGYIKGQELEIIQNTIVSDSIDYLTAEFNFSTNEWDGFIKWAHFKKDDIVYDVLLADDKILKSQHLNLSAGVWEVYVHGNKSGGTERITTNIVKLTVEPTGALNGEPLPEIPLEVAEQIMATIGSLDNLETTEKSNIVAAINEAVKTGRILNIEQTKTSSEDKGENEITISLADGKNFSFKFYNGSKGSKGDKGDPGEGGGLFYVNLTQDSEGNYTADKTFDEIKAAYAENKEIIVCSVGSFFRLVAVYSELESIEIMYFSAMFENTHGMLFCNATKWVFDSFTFVTKDSIVQEISESSLSGKIPSAKAVYTAIQSAIGNAPVFEYLTEETTEEIPCTGLTLEPDILSFSGSGQQTIVATALPADTTDSVTWLSSDKNVATVSNGIVTAVGNGDCTITATCGSQSASCSVNVSGISTVVSVTGVTLDKATASVDTGSTVMLTATIEPSNASNQNISWSSDNETVATVENGTVTGVSAGTATIGVMTEDGGYSAVCNVTVNEVVVSEYRNLFDKDTMVTANQGIPSTGVIGSYTWGLARVPVQENSQYSYKTVEDYADNERTYYGGATAGCIGFADSNGEIISRLSFAITQAQLDATDNNGLNCLLRDYTHGEIPEGEAYPKGFGWVTFTTPAGCAYLLFNTTLKNNADKIQLEAGDTIHNYYLPYSGGVE